MKKEDVINILTNLEKNKEVKFVMESGECYTTSIDDIINRIDIEEIHLNYQGIRLPYCAIAQILPVVD